jgi:hypothetical protein
MKYKNIELVADEDSEAELLCSVEFDNPKESEKIVDNLVDEILNLFKEFKNEVEIEAVTADIVNVRCWDITFDKPGVELLTEIYNKLVNYQFMTLAPKILIGIHVDGDKWFKREDGSEYNEDAVSMEEFLANLEF